MRHGNYVGYGFYGSYIFSFLIILIIISAIIFILYKQKKNIIFEKSLELLRDKYVMEEISADEFREKKSIIEDLEASSPEVVFLVNRYIKGEIDLRKFYEFLEQIKR